MVIVAVLGYATWIWIKTPESCAPERLREALAVRLQTVIQFDLENLEAERGEQGDGFKPNHASHATSLTNIHLTSFLGFTWVPGF